MTKTKTIKKLRAALLRTAKLPFQFIGKLSGLWRLGWRNLIRRFWEFREPDWTKEARKLATPPKSFDWKSLFNPLYWVVWIWKFVYEWLITRPYGNIGPALFALLAAGGLSAVYIWAHNKGRVTKIAMYRQLLQQSADKDDPKIAMLSVQRLLDESPNDLDLQLQHALLLCNGKPDETAKRTIWELSVNKRHGPSAYWLVSNQYPLDDISKWTPNQHTEFRALVEIALNSLKTKRLDDVRLSLASYLAQQGARRDALKVLSEIATRNPDVAFVGLHLAFQERNDELAKDFASLALNHFSARLKIEPASVDLRVNLAKALVVLQKEQEAALSLQDGLQLTGLKPEDTEKLRNSIGEVLVYFVQRLKNENSPSETLLQRLQVISNALRFAPNNPDVVSSVVDIVFECHKNGDKQVTTLRSALVNGAAPEAVHFIKGTLELMAGRAETAKSHLEIAQSTGLNMPGILNNLAMALVESGKEETLQQAFDLSSEAVRLMPDHPYLRDTRGRVLLKMKRYTEAVPELEYALRASELAADLHKLLSETYAELGQAELSADHLKMHEQLAKKPSN